MLTTPTDTDAMSERRHEIDAERARQRHDDIAAGHGEGAMRQVDETHQPHRDRKADGGDEQKHGVSQAVEQNADGYDGKMRHEPHPVVDEKRRRAFMRGGAVECQTSRAIRSRSGRL